MQAPRKKNEKIFLTVSTLAMLFVLTETVMQFFGKSICFTEGCKVVSQQVRYGEISILLIGLATFALLALCSALNRYYVAPGLSRFINLILIVSLACEGFFTGYQAFSVHTPCVFCLIILGLIMLLGMIRLFSGQKELVAGFASFAAVFTMLYLVLPAGTNVSLPENERLILFYSNDCKHCAEVMKDIEENKLSVKHLEVNEYSAFLKSLGIDAVPTLYVNDKYQRVFITGKEAIKRYLSLCAETSKAPPAETTVKPRSGKASTQTKSTEPGMSIDIFTQHGIIPQLGEPLAENGMCKENEICK
jgi:hypothetical protein